VEREGISHGRVHPRGGGGGEGKRGRDLASPTSITMSHRTMDQFFITIALLRTLYKHSRAQVESRESRDSMHVVYAEFMQIRKKYNKLQFFAKRKTAQN